MGASKSHAFSEADWQQASAYMAKQRSTATRKRALYLSLLLLLLVGIPTGLWLATNNDDVDNQTGSLAKYENRKTKSHDGNLDSKFPSDQKSINETKSETANEGNEELKFANQKLDQENT